MPNGPGNGFDQQIYGKVDAGLGERVSNRSQ